MAESDIDFDPIAGVEAATAAGRELRERARHARWVATHYALQALERGATVGAVMDAIGFEAKRRSRGYSIELFDNAPGTPEEQFAEWLGQSVAQHIKQLVEEESNGRGSTQ